MKKYELLYILRPDLDDESRNKAIEVLHGIITSNGGKITKVDQWGLKTLAYSIKDQIKGFYVCVKFEADNAALNEFNRLGKINQNLLRHLIVVDHAE